MRNMRVYTVKVVLNASCFMYFPLAFHLPLQKPRIWKKGQKSGIFGYSGGPKKLGGTPRGRIIIFSKTPRLKVSPQKKGQ